MTNAEIIALLQEDLKGELMAIVQYLRHAYAMGEGELAAEIEAIAREEMRHFDWVAEIIVELGGKPSMERGAFTGMTDDAVQNMRADVQAEVDAINLYRQHIEAIPDPKIQRLLSRILSDEESHHGDFVHFVDKAGAMAEAAPAEAPAAEAKPAGPPARLAAILHEGIQHEYTVILQYLYHRFMMPDCEIGNELEMQAINEMQHLGWLSEEMEGIGGTPEIEHTGLELPDDPEEMLEADIKVERMVTAAYSRQIPEIEDPGLKDLVTRIRDHEIYHIELFGDLLEEVEAQEKESAPPEEKPAAPSAPQPPTVGSLFGQKQD